MATETAVNETPAPTTRWPKVVGTLGVILGGIMFVDKADDMILIPLMWGGDSRSLLLGPEMGEIVARSMPNVVGFILYLLLGMLLGLMLIIGSLRLRRRSPSGVTLCRAWAWLSIVWLAAGMTVALWWLGDYGDEVASVAGTGWHSTAFSGTLLALAILLAYPVFLLVWLSRAPVKEEYLTWRE